MGGWRHVTPLVTDGTKYQRNPALPSYRPTPAWPHLTGGFQFLMLSVAYALFTQQVIVYWSLVTLWWRYSRVQLSYVCVLCSWLSVYQSRRSERHQRFVSLYWAKRGYMLEILLSFNKHLSAQCFLLFGATAVLLRCWLSCYNQFWKPG